MTLVDLENEILLIAGNDGAVQPYINGWILAAIDQLALDFHLPALRLIQPTTLACNATNWLYNVPANYHKYLFLARDSEYTKITLVGLMDDLEAKDPDHDETGDHVTHLCVQDGRIAIYPMAAETIKVWFYEKPSYKQWLAAPGALTAALAGAGAGNLNNGVYSYKATLVNANGETEAGTVSANVTVADKTTNGKVALTAIPTGGFGTTARKIYRTAVNGSSYKLLTTISNNMATTYTDNVADGSLGATAPTENTTSNVLACLPTEFQRRLIIPKLVLMNLEAMIDSIVEPPLQSYAYWFAAYNRGLYGTPRSELGFVHWLARQQGNKPKVELNMDHL